MRAGALLCVALCVLAGGCRATVDRAAVGGAIADAQTAARVKTALVNDPDLGLRTIEVTVAGGTARLSGRVLSQAELDRAVRIARSVEGVTGVEVALQVGAEPPPPSDPLPQPAPQSGIEPFEPDGDPDLLAVGASFATSRPRDATLRSRTSIGPLIRLGAGEGLGLAIGFDWFKADLATTAGRGTSLTRVHVKPVMVGLAYTMRSDRVSVSPGIVGGYAFNSVSVTDTGRTAGPLVVEVDNSFVWRPGASLWFEATRRVAVNVSAGYVMTRLGLTVVEDGRLSKARRSGDTLVLRAGLAYKLF